MPIGNSNLKFEFATAGKIHFGSQKSELLPGLARSLGQKVLWVTGRNQIRFSRLKDGLLKSDLEVQSVSVPGEPCLEFFPDLLDMARTFGPDLVVAIGGGSVLDAGKALAALTVNPGDPLEYMEVIGNAKRLDRDPLPVIALPTTAGTGSEVTRNAVMGSRQHGAKASIRDERMLPRIAIVDPNLTLEMPPEVTAASGMDALTQCIEPWLCNRSNPVTDALSLEGIRRASASLETAVSYGKDLVARTDMALASLFGGLALANAGLGAVHGLAAPLGGRFPAPHGALCAALLPFVLETNLTRCLRGDNGENLLRRYIALSDLLCRKTQSDPFEGVEWVKNLSRRIRIPSLRSLGVDPGQTDEIAAAAMKAGSMKANPVALDHDDLCAILERAWSGLNPSTP